MSLIHTMIKLLIPRANVKHIDIAIIINKACNSLNKLYALLSSFLAKTLPNDDTDAQLTRDVISSRYLNMKLYDVYMLTATGPTKNIIRTASTLFKTK